MSRISILRSAKSPVASFWKSSAARPAGLKLTQVLLAQALIRCQQDDSVELVPSPVFVQVELVLQDVGVHQQCLAAACGAQVSDLVDLRPRFATLIEQGDVVALRLVAVEGGDLLVNCRQQRFGVAEIAIEVDFGQQ